MTSVASEAMHLSAIAFGLTVAALILAMAVAAQPDERAAPMVVLGVLVVALAIVLLLQARRNGSQQ